jgi:hypothetical protein
MYFYGLNGKKIELTEADNEPISGLLGDALRPGDVNEQAHDIIRLARATRTFFGSPVNEGTLRKAGPRRPPSIYRDGQTKLLRCFYRELVVRFRPHVSEQKRRDYLGRFGLQIVRGNPFVLDQIVVRDPNDVKRGNDLIDVANALAELDDDIVLAVPNFVSQFKRAVPAIPAEQWHLDNTGQVPGQMPGEDVRAKQGWGIATGNPAIIVAVLDDGVDIEHPALKNQIWRNPDVASPDQYGRDFFLDPTDAGYFDPRPKVFRAPFNEMSGNDIHGTPCAALVVANASDARAFGVAVNCRILPVKIFHADAFASDEKVSNAFQHAASIADILSCSWVSPETPLIERAMEDATSKGRNGKVARCFVQQVTMVNQSWDSQLGAGTRWQWERQLTRAIMRPIPISVPNWRWSPHRAVVFEAFSHVTCRC